MAKSSYLDNLISGATPNKYKVRYLTELWNDNSVNTYDTYRYSITNNFSNTRAVAVAGSDYLNNLNTNQTVLDMNDPYLATVTLNSEFLPTYRRPDVSVENLSIKAPPEYLPAKISAIKNGITTAVIPILFPKAFGRSRSASFAKENPVGSTVPIMAYSYTDAEEIPLEFDALVDYLPSGYESLSAYVDAVFSILKPTYGTGNNSNVVYEPTVKVEFADIVFMGVCTSVQVSYDNLYHPKYELDAAGNLKNIKPSFAHASISCQFTKLGS